MRAKRYRLFPPDFIHTNLTFVIIPFRLNDCVSNNENGNGDDDYPDHTVDPFSCVIETVMTLPFAPNTLK